MPSQQLKHYYSLSLFLLIFILGSRTAEACSCGPSPTVLDSFNHSDVVVIVNVLSVEKAEPAKTAPQGQMSDGENYVDGVKSTSTRVEQVFKGSLKVGDEMIFAQGGGADCIWTFNESDIGKKYLFYLRQYKDSSRWMGFTCGRSNLVDHAPDDLLYLTNHKKVRNKTRISGTLGFRYDAGESVAGRKIRIIGAKRTVEVKTDDNGVYEIYDLPAGRYFVEPEIPKGWKVALFWLRYSPSVDRNAKDGSLQKIPIILEANKHAGLDIMFQIDNAIRGHIYDPMGQFMNDVCLKLIPAEGTEETYRGTCTEKDGAFEIDEIAPGGYLLVVNDDGKMTSSEPFGKFYYPKTLKREEATVFNIDLGDVIDNLEIYPPIEVKTIVIKGVLLYSDGKPVANESVYFKQSAGNDEDEEDRNYQTVKTDLNGRFSIKLLQGANGVLYGHMYSYVGKFENCPKLDRLIKQSGSDFADIRTPGVEIRATTNLYEVELKFPFPACKKAQKRNQ